MLVNSFRRVGNIAIAATICICLLLGWTQIQSPILLANAQPGAHNVRPEISNGTGNVNVKRVILFAHDAIVQVAPDNQLKPGGVMYEAMTFNGTIPGPLISVNQGDTLEITLVNQEFSIESSNRNSIIEFIMSSMSLSTIITPSRLPIWLKSEMRD